MAITQAQSDKDWKDYPDTSTPISAADLKAMSRRIRDHRWMVPTGHTSIDEFDDDVMDPAWVRADGAGAPVGNATWAEGGDTLSLGQAGGDSANTIRGLVRPIGTAPVVGDAFVTHMTLGGGMGGNLVIGGIVLSDTATYGSGEQVAGVGYIDMTSLGATFNTFGFSNWGGGSAGTSGSTRGYSFFLRLVKLASNAWRGDVSPDGVTWIQGPSSFTKAFTPTHVGLCSSSWGTAAKGAIGFEFLRRTSGVS